MLSCRTRRDQKEGGEVLYGGHVLNRPGYFVEPTIVRAKNEWPIVQRETFAPILYVMPFQTIDEAITMQNNVPQGLSSAIFSNDVRHGEQFVSAAGSDCGIANVNIGTSGAEIGGAFGGEKDTGGGREAGSDSWKPICVGKPIPSTGEGNCRLPRGSSLDRKEDDHGPSPVTGCTSGADGCRLHRA
ncbi:MAG: aldehyde dehydrogenase family protein [Nitrospira sp.]